MTLPASGAISLGNVNVELSLSGAASISMNSSNVRTLFAKSSGVISMYDGYGKSNYRIGTVGTFQVNNYGASGLTIFVYVDGAQPYSSMSMSLIYTTSGQPLGSQSIGSCDVNGSLRFSSNIAFGEPYWYPISKTNGFSVYQDGSNLLGTFYVYS